MKQYGWKILLAGTILIIIAMGTLQGCAKQLPSPTITSIEQAGVQGAAVYVGTQYPNTVPVILQVCSYIINIANGGQVTTPAQVNAEILAIEAASPKLTAADKAAINVFLVTLQPLIAQEIATVHMPNTNLTIELCWVAQWASNILGQAGTCNVQPTLVTAPTTS
jgi:hypothetical protein